MTKLCLGATLVSIVPLFGTMVSMLCFLKPNAAVLYLLAAFVPMSPTVGDLRVNTFLPGSLCAGPTQTKYTLAHTPSDISRERCIQLFTIYTCMTVDRHAKIRFHVRALSVPVQRPGDGKSLSASEV